MVRRTPQGVRGLKSSIAAAATWTSRRTPQGVRGLKFFGSEEDDMESSRRTPQGVRGLK